MPLRFSNLNRLTKILKIMGLLIVSSSASAQAPTPGTYVFLKRQSGHTARIIIRTRAFDSTKHKIGFLNNSQPMIDGRLAYGAESTPRTEIAALDFYFDGQRIPVNRRLFADCYAPNVYHGKGLTIRFSRNFQRVFAHAFGADGAGSYHVIWVLGRSGRHRRYFKPTF
jgi:hypothetical protein